MADKYIDPTASTNGSGTESSPYNGFTEINALSGDQGGDILYLKAGTSIKSKIALTSCSNFAIDKYGTGAKPIIDGSDVYTGAWTFDATYNAWYTTYAEAGAYFANEVNLIEITYVSTKKYLVGEYVWYSTTGLTYICIQQTFGGTAPSNASYWTATTVLPTGLMWFKTAASRIYISLGGTDPNTVTMERNTSGRTSCITLTSCSDCRVSNLNLIRGWSSNLIVTTTGNNVEISDNALDYAGGWNSQGRDGMSVYGDYLGTKSTGISILRNTGSYCQNNLIEIDALDGCIIEENEGTDNGQLIELWGYNVNTKVRRNRSLRSIPLGSSNSRGYGIWISGPTAGSSNQGANTDTTVDSNVFVNGYNGGIEVGGGAGHLIYNNTIALVAGYYNSGACITLTATEAVASCINNVMYMPLAGQSSIITVAGTTYTGDYNHVWRGIAFDLTNNWGGSYLGTFYNKLSTWRTATSQDANSTVSDPLFTAPDTFDLSYQGGSPCLAAGDSYWTAGTPIPLSYNGELFRDPPNRGAMEEVSPFSPSQTAVSGGGYGG